MIETKMEATYSQNGEDAVVLRDLGDIKDPCILDIGAGHPEKLSNSCAFIQRGWRAVLIEPSPTFFAELIRVHGKNPKVTLIHAAVGTEPRMVRFHEA